MTASTLCATCAQPVLADEVTIEVSADKVAHLMCPVDEVVTTPIAKPSTVGRSAAGRAATVTTTTSLASIEVFTDGACRGNPGHGGWAWVTADGRQARGSAPNTTNQRMEIRAALEAVLANQGPIVVVSDSTYVVNCFKQGWWRRWKRQGWTTASRSPVANRDLWEPLVDLVIERGDVAFRWVKGHSGERLNELADKLAVQASRTL